MKCLCPIANVYAPDLPGYGLSPFPPTTGHSLEDLTFGLIELMNHVGVERGYFVGHGIGALMALNLSILRPERVIKIIAAAANPQWISPPGSDWPFPIAPQLIAILEAAAQPDANLLLLAIQANDLIDPIRCPPRELLIPQYVRTAASFQRYEALLAAIDFRQAAALVPVPVLLMGGLLDPIAPIGAVRFLNDVIPNSAIVEFPDQGHNYALFNSKLFNQHVLTYFFRNCDPCCAYLRSIVRLPIPTCDETYVPDCGCHHYSKPTIPLTPLTPVYRPAPTTRTITSRTISAPAEVARITRFSAPTRFVRRV